MKQHIFTRGGVLLAVMSVLLSFFACRQDLQVAPVESSLSPTESIKRINASKGWFASYKKSGMVERSPTFKNIEVLWDEAVAIGRLVEVPFLLNGERNFPSLYEDVIQSGKQRLVIIDRGAEGRKVYIFDYMLSKDFIGKIEDVHLNFRSKQFDGMFAAHTFDSDSISGFVWDKGKLTKRLHAKSGGFVLRDCFVQTYEFACGRVMGGPRQCSQGSRLICWRPAGGAGGVGGGGDSGDDGISNGCRPYYIGCGDKDTDDSQYYLNNPPSPPVTDMCPFAMKAGITDGAVTHIPLFQNSTTSDPASLRVNCRGFTAIFKDLQTTGQNPINIPLFDLFIYCPLTTTVYDYETIANRLAQSYNIANGNSWATTPQEFLDAWAQAFTQPLRNPDGTLRDSNGKYGMTRGSIMQVDPTIPIQNYPGVSVMNSSSSSCR